MLHIIIAILVVGLVCGGLIYVLDRMPFIGPPFNAIIKVVVIIGAILIALNILGLFDGFGSLAASHRVFH